MVSKIIFLAILATLIVIVASLQEAAEGEKSSVQKVDLLEPSGDSVRDERRAWAGMRKRRKSTTTVEPRRKSKPTKVKDQEDSDESKSTSGSEEKSRAGDKQRPRSKLGKDAISAESEEDVTKKKKRSHRYRDRSSGGRGRERGYGYEPTETPCESDLDCKRPGETCEQADIPEREQRGGKFRKNYHYPTYKICI